MMGVIHQSADSTDSTADTIYVEKAHSKPSTLEPTTPPQGRRPTLAEHGPLIDHNIPQAQAIEQRPDLWWNRVRRTLQEPFSEFLGTFILLLFGDGVVAQVVLSGGKNGDYQSINWGWG